MGYLAILRWFSFSFSFASAGSRTAVVSVCRGWVLPPRGVSV